MDCSKPGYSVHHWLLELAQTYIHQVGDAIQPSHPLLSSSPPAFNLPSIRVFPNESVLCIRWPKYWSFSFRPSNEYSGLFSFKIDSFDLLAVQGTLKSLLQHHSSKASILQCLVFFMVQLSHIQTWLLEKTQLWLYTGSQRPQVSKRTLSKILRTTGDNLLNFHFTGITYMCYMLCYMVLSLFYIQF